MRPRSLRVAGDRWSWQARKGRWHRGWAGSSRAGPAGTRAQLSGACASWSRRDAPPSLVAPSPCFPSRPSPRLPARTTFLPPSPALKGVLGFLRFLMNPGWAARKMWGRDVRRPVASPASPSSPSWAGAPPRHRGSPPGGQPGNAACLCPRRRRSRRKAGRLRLATAQIRTAPRSQALSTIPPSLSLAWVRIARRESGPE